MITDKEFLEKELEIGVGFHNPIFLNLATSTAEQLDIEFKTVLDYGAGTGVYADAFHKKGYDVSVYEIWKAHTDYIKKNAPHLKIVKKPITTDLMLFIEVAEHMTDKELDSLFSKIKPRYILFSSTSQKTDYDAEWGHINVKPQDEWVTYFDKLNYNLIKNYGCPTSWTKLFQYDKAI